MMDDVTCPFCGEDDFDLIGLKNHFLAGYCDTFNDVESIPTFLARMGAAREAERIASEAETSDPEHFKSFFDPTAGKP